jgi:hypothetical protein
MVTRELFDRAWLLIAEAVAIPFWFLVGWRIDSGRSHLTKAMLGFRRRAGSCWRCMPSSTARLVAADDVLDRLGNLRRRMRGHLALARGAGADDVATSAAMRRRIKRLLS